MNLGAYQFADNSRLFVPVRARAPVRAAVRVSRTGIHAPETITHRNLTRTGTSVQHLENAREPPPDREQTLFQPQSPTTANITAFL